MKQVTERDIEILQGFSTNAADILRGLLKRNPEERLNIDQIKSHAFFSDINWDALLEKRVTPPFIPKVRSQTDTSQIDSDFTDEVPRETIQENSHLLKTANIDQFTYAEPTAFLDR